MSLWSRLREKLAALRGRSLADFFSPATTPEHSDAFAMAVVALGAKMAKADGRVTRDEVVAFREVFVIEEHDLEDVARFFDLARKDVAGFEIYARRIGRMFRGREDALETLLEGLFHIARADGELHDAEVEFLRIVSEAFAVSPRVFETLKLRNDPEGTSPFDVLGIAPDSSADDARAAWRRLAARYHPDRLRGQGVPMEAVRLSEIRLAEINTAYEAIRQLHKRT